MRVLVHYSAVFSRRPTIHKTLGVFAMAGHEYTLEMGPLSFYTRWRDKGLIMEVFCYHEDDWDDEDLWEYLEDFHSPFTKSLEFRDPEHLSDYLAFSPDVKFIADPLHPMRFGSKSLDSI